MTDVNIVQFPTNNPASASPDEERQRSLAHVDSLADTVRSLLKLKGIDFRCIKGWIPKTTLGSVIGEFAFEGLKFRITMNQYLGTDYFGDDGSVLVKEIRDSEPNE